MKIPSRKSDIFQKYLILVMCVQKLNIIKYLYFTYLFKKIQTIWNFKIILKKHTVPRYVELNVSDISQIIIPNILFDILKCLIVS